MATKRLNEIFEAYCLSSPRSSAGSTVDSLDSVDMNSPSKDVQEYKFSERSRKFWKGCLAVFCFTAIFLARYSVPNNQIEKLEDKVLNGLQFINDWIHEHGNESIRSLLQFICAIQIDFIFFATGIYWMRNTHNGRLPFATLVFYIIRAIVQALWWSPFPEGFYWESPGIPSLVAPYGRGSDFFFSGHSGFLVLMANEWDRVGNRRMRNYCRVNLVYTILILLVYQIHYSIDIFTGVFFADYVFNKVEMNLESVDRFWKRNIFYVEKFAKAIKNLVVGPSLSASKKTN